MRLQYDANELLPSAYTEDVKVIFDQNAISVKNQMQQSTRLIFAPKRIVCNSENAACTCVAALSLDADDVSLLFITPVYD